MNSLFFITIYNSITYCQKTYYCAFNSPILYARPPLTEEQRINLFELDRDEQKILVTNLSMSSKIDAILRLGYFKLKQQFFQFDLTEVSDDVKYIMERYFSPTDLDKYTISYVTKNKNQRWVLSATGYKLFSQAQDAAILLNKAEKLCPLSVNPVFIFRELLAEITCKKITRPGYSTLQKIISAALVAEQKRISQIFCSFLNKMMCLPIGENCLKI